MFPITPIGTNVPNLTSKYFLLLYNVWNYSTISNILEETKWMIQNVQKGSRKREEYARLSTSTDKLQQNQRNWWTKIVDWQSKTLLTLLEYRKDQWKAFWVTIWVEGKSRLLQKTLNFVKNRRYYYEDKTLHHVFFSFFASALHLRRTTLKKMKCMYQNK